MMFVIKWWPARNRTPFTTKGALVHTWFEGKCCANTQPHQQSVGAELGEQLAQWATSYPPKVRQAPGPLPATSTVPTWRGLPEAAGVGLVARGAAPAVGPDSVAALVALGLT